MYDEFRENSMIIPILRARTRHLFTQLFMQDNGFRNLSLADFLRNNP
ncbi:hypothetical protein AGR6A_Lc90228 [Agrobacterium sp. NCPPB 925]|nr:hypothetical protein AGR6A_Lc90228 [Agrobacterium sp. NCPPB 925]